MIPAAIPLSSRIHQFLFRFSRGTEPPSLVCWRSIGKRWFQFRACGRTRTLKMARIILPMRMHTVVCEPANLSNPILLMRVARCLFGRMQIRTRRACLDSKTYG